MTRVQEAAVTFRRSGALVALADGEEKRIFDAVVKPERRGAAPTAAVEAERERLRKEIARCEGMLANERFVENARPEVVAAEREKLERYRRELEALGRVDGPPGTLRQTPVTVPDSDDDPGGHSSWVEALSPWPERFGLERMRRLLADLGRPAAPLPGDPRRRDERQDLDDADDRGAPTCRPACESGAYDLPARARLVRADPGRRRGRRPRTGARPRAPPCRRRDAVRGADRGGPRRVRRGRASTSRSSRPGSAAATTRPT